MMCLWINRMILFYVSGKYIEENGGGLIRSTVTRLNFFLSTSLIHPSNYYLFFPYANNFY